MTKMTSTQRDRIKSALIKYPVENEIYSGESELKDGIAQLVEVNGFNFFGTLTFKESYSNDTYWKALKKWSHCMDKFMLGRHAYNNDANSDKRLRFIAFIEKPRTENPHYHLMIRHMGAPAALSLPFHDIWRFKKSLCGLTESTDLQYADTPEGALEYSMKGLHLLNPFDTYDLITSHEFHPF